MKTLETYALVAAGAALLLAAAFRIGRSEHVAPVAAGSSPASQATTADTLPGLESRVRGARGSAADWQALAAVYFDRGRFADAARAFARVADLAPSGAEHWSALGEALVRRDNAVGDDAAHAFRRALSIDAGDARSRYFLAVRQDMRGDHRAAVDAWIALLHDAPVGAAWAPTVRALIEQVAARQGIDLTGRMPAPPISSPSAGAAIAADGIPGPSAEQLRDAARLSPTQQDAMARAMVDRLAARLAADPHDAPAWMRLMRARTVLGDRAGATRAYADAKRAFAGDNAALAQLSSAANALGVRD